jgi:acetyl esterase/lipase
VVLYFHGGGFYEGSCEAYRAFAGQLSLASGTRVLTVDYRLAPENKYPAANEDCLGAYRWLLKNGVSAKDIIIGGDSAGGTLTLMTLLSLRDAGDQLPAAAFTLSAVTDYIDFDGESYASRAKLDPLMSSLDKVKVNMDRYLDPSKQKETPSIFSPLKQDLGGLPPLLLQVGDHEILLSDSVRFAERAKKAGVDTTLEIYPNMFHCFQLTFFLMPEAKKAITNIGSFIQKHINIHDK